MIARVPAIRHRFIWLFFFAASIFWVAPGPAHGDTISSDQAIWKSFSFEQKTYALSGFIDCHKGFFPHSNTFVYTDRDRVYKRIDKLVAEQRTNRMGDLILEAINGTPPAVPDIHAEHGSVDDGMLWRGLREQEKQAYVQGVLWCTQMPKTKAAFAPQESIQQVVEKLNNWYVVSDDDWKDPRSNARVDVPVMSALQRVEVLRAKNNASQSAHN